MCPTNMLTVKVLVISLGWCLRCCWSNKVLGSYIHEPHGLAKSLDIHEETELRQARDEKGRQLDETGKVKQA